MVDGLLNLVTHDGNGQLTVTEPGVYSINYTITYQVDHGNEHIEAAISVNGTESGNGVGHAEDANADTEDQLSGTAILSLADDATVNLSIRTTDAGDPDLAVEYIDITLHMLGGT